MIITNPNEVWAPSKDNLKVSNRNGLLVLEFGDKWFALSKDQAIKLVQAMAEHINRIV